MFRTVFGHPARNHTLASVSTFRALPAGGGPRPRTPRADSTAISRRKAHDQGARRSPCAARRVRRRRGPWRTCRDPACARARRGGQNARVLSLHREGRSPVHAVPAGVKLLVLFAAGTALFFVRSVAVLGGALAGVALCYALARVPWRVVARQVLTVVPFAVALSAVQWLVTGWEAAVLVGLRMLVLVMLANLVTLTTRTSAMVAAIEAVLRPLAPLGVRPERVGLLVAMTIRFIPVIKEQADQVRAAQRARGVERSTAFLAPLLVKTLRLADGLGEALDARGVDGAAARPGKTPRSGKDRPL
ncbi:hypothetical protein CTZ27_37795 [Streptomyces griseocarneus]|nr:hypothetical protein CTZ27_37795 [Streptomyces griseocarneus]